MKKFKLLSALVLMIIVGCNRQNVSITIELSDQPEINNLVYTVPISGTTFYHFNDTLKQSETGKFELNLKVNEPSFIIFFGERFQVRCKLLIEPGKSYHVSIDEQNNVQITGANEKGQMLYATLPYPIWMDDETRKWIGPNDTLPFFSIHQQIADLKQTDLSNFKELLGNKEITKSFFDLIQTDRNCYYASFEALLLILKSDDNYRSYRLRSGLENEDKQYLADYMEKIYDQYPSNDENLLFSYFWWEYADRFVRDYKQFIQGNLDSKELRNNGTYNTYIINEAKKYFSGKALEFHCARYIMLYCAEFGLVDKEFISLFEQFERDYPKSEYSKFLKPYIDKIIDYHQAIEQDFDSGTLFMDNYKTVNTLAEAVKPFQGKKIYIDVWATWCGPCKVEFAHNEALKKVLAENDIQIIYISTDGANQEQTWKNDIKYYNLIGTHIHANSELAEDLRKLFPRNEERPVFSIPWYILVDEQGNIIEEYAKRPSQIVAGESLFTN